MKRFYSFFILLVACLMTVSVQADELTVNDGTSTNEYVPVYGYYADTSGESQFVLSSTDLSSVANKSITALKFYANSNFSFTGKWNVKLLETTATGISSSYQDLTEAALVYYGSLNITGNECLITFDEPFIYSGTKNLLIDFTLSQKGNYSSSGVLKWYGVADGASRGGGSYPSDQTFSPKVTLIYQVPPTCAKPSGLKASNVTDNSADLSWTENGSATAWQIRLNGDDDQILDVTETSYPLTGLTALTAYTVEVRANCGGEFLYYCSC